MPFLALLVCAAALSAPAHAAEDRLGTAAMQRARSLAGAGSAGDDRVVRHLLAAVGARFRSEQRVARHEFEEQGEYCRSKMEHLLWEEQQLDEVVREVERHELGDRREDVQRTKGEISAAQEDETALEEELSELERHRDHEEARNATRHRLRRQEAARAQYALKTVGLLRSLIPQPDEEGADAAGAAAEAKKALDALGEEASSASASAAALLEVAEDGDAMDAATRRRALHRSLESLEAQLRGKVEHEHRGASGLSETTQDDLRLVGHQAEALAHARRNTERRLRHLRAQLRNQEADVAMVRDTMQQAVTARRATRSRMQLLNSSCELYGSAYETASMYRTRIEELVQESRFMLSHSVQARSLEKFLTQEEGEMGSAEAALQSAVDQQREAFEALADERRRVFATPPEREREHEHEAEKSMTGASGRSEGHTGVAASEEEKKEAKPTRESKEDPAARAREQEEGEEPAPRREAGAAPLRLRHPKTQPKMVLKKTGQAPGRASREAYGKLVADATGATGLAGAAMRNMTEGAPVVLDAANLGALAEPEDEETGPEGPAGAGVPAHRHEIKVVNPAHLPSVTGATGGKGVNKQGVRVLLRAAVQKAVADAAGRVDSKEDALTAIDEEMQHALAEYIGAQQGQGAGRDGTLSYNATSEAGATHVMTGPYEKYSRLIFRTVDTELAKPDVQDLPVNEMKAALMVALETALDATPTGATGVWVRSKEPERKESGVARADSEAEGPAAEHRPSGGARKAEPKTASAAPVAQPTGGPAAAEEEEDRAVDEAELARREEEVVRGRATGSTGTAGTGTAGQVMEDLRSMERKMHDAVTMRGSMEETEVLAAKSGARASEERQRVGQLKAERKAAVEVLRSARDDVIGERQRMVLLRDREQKLRRARQQLLKRITSYRKAQKEAEERMAKAEAEAEEARKRAGELRALRRRVAALAGPETSHDATGAAGVEVDDADVASASGATGLEWAAPELYHSPGPSEEDVARQEQRVRNALGSDSGAGHVSSDPVASLLEEGGDSLADARAEAEALGVTLPHEPKGMLSVLDQETERLEQRAASHEAVAADHEDDASAAAEKAAAAEKEMPGYEEELKQAVQQLRGAVSSLDESNDEVKEDEAEVKEATKRVKAGARAAAKMEGAAVLHKKHAARLGKLVQAAEDASTGATGGATAVAGYAEEASEATAEHRALVRKVVGAYGRAAEASATGPSAASTGPASPASSGEAASATGTAGARLWSDHAAEVAAELRSGKEEHEATAAAAATDSDAAAATASASAFESESHASSEAASGPAADAPRPAAPEMDDAEAQAVRELEAQVRAEARQEVARGAQHAEQTSLVRRMEAAIHEEAHAASGTTGATGAAGEGTSVAETKQEAEQVGQAPSATGAASSHGTQGVLRFVGHDAREGDMCAQLSGADDPQTSDHSGFLELWEVQAGHEEAQHWLFREDRAMCLAEHPDYCLTPQGQDGKVHVDYAPLQEGADATPLQDQSGLGRLRRRGSASSSNAAAWTFTPEGRVCLSARASLCLTADARSSNDVSVVLAEASDSQEDHQRWLFDTA